MVILPTNISNYFSSPEPNVMLHVLLFQTFTLMIGFLYPYTCSVAKTVIESDIYGTRRWVSSNSPYVIPRTSITIHPEATLIIDPGVHIRVGSGLGLRVRGKLVARGTPGELTCAFFHPK